MTRDQVDELMRENGIVVVGEAVYILCNLVESESAAAEREACAKVCEAECNPTPHEGHITSYQSGGYITAEYLASAIRARGQRGD